MDENDGPLILVARRAATRPFDPEREERGCRGNTKSLLRDRVPCRSFGHLIVLDHGVPPHSGKTVAVPPPGRPGLSPAQAPLRTVRESFPSYGSSLIKGPFPNGPSCRVYELCRHLSHPRF